ncbi:hypothetical protein TUM19329_29070 [Legionella antarctica]|uniref:Uncharacterized protein n=1 Tax=Legionella antarctica TaxID=2708020 RepID=A0A6F8T988_9GAMM|nr:hypothetical protein [Legionella antarctica]BCA96546.1 hypothetical protein TUM19329_29070 [Legionella antarctica]
MESTYKALPLNKLRNKEQKAALLIKIGHDDDLLTHFKISFKMFLKLSYWFELSTHKGQFLKTVRNKGMKPIF